MSSAHAASSRVGTMFGPYQLQSLLGVGGMGEVYRAHDTVKDRTVAVKLLRAEFAADAGFQARFRRESRVAARLQEPHVIPVHDWGDIDGVLYIDMRLVDGANVKKVLRDGGPLPPTRATSIVAQVAAALDAAHADGLVHRDVKPENVLLTADDFAYLVDFGIAHAGADTGLTNTGAAIGSWAYMAPERFTGRQVGPRADVYALTCLLYECLTGRPPFAASEISHMMGAHLMAPPPRPSAMRPGLSPAFDDVIARGMAKEPTVRFPSAGELGHAASRAAAGRPVPIRPASPTVRQAVPQPRAAYAESVPLQRNRFGRGQLMLAGAAIAALAAAALITALVFVGGTRDSSGSVTAAPPAQPGGGEVPAGPSPDSPPARSAPNQLPGTDTQGFVDYAGARCDAGNPPAVMARTTQSVLVICRTGPGDFYYRGVRLSDGASIELTNAVRSSGGFDVTNPVDGTRYEVRPYGLTIMMGGEVPVSEPMVGYASV